MRTFDWIGVSGLLVVLASMGCSDSDGGGSSSGGGGAGPSSTSATTTATAGQTTTSSSQGQGGAGGAGMGGAGHGGAGHGGAGHGGAGPFVCGDGLVVPGERCGVAMGLGAAPDTAPSNLVVADIDEDGDADLVSAAVILRNDGGTWTNVNLDTANGGRIDLGYVDDDEHLDLVVPMVDTVEILAGNGDGTFQSPLVLPLSTEGGQDVAIGDIDGDGLNDVAAVTLEGTVTFFLADGAGSFRAEDHTFGSQWLIEIQIADLDGDGTSEVVVSEEYNVVDVWHGNAWTSYETTDTIRQFSLVDLDDDGALDFVAASTDGQAVDVLPGDGAAGFGPSVTTSLPWVTRSLAASDFDGDGLVDVAVGSIPLYSDDPPIHEIAFLYGADGGFEPVIVEEFACDPRNFGAGDLNGDGVPDVAGVCQSEGSPTSTGAGGAPPAAIGLWMSNP